MTDSTYVPTGRYTWTPPWPETRRERIARAIAPAGWYRGRRAPTLPAAVLDRARLEWRGAVDTVPELPGAIADWARLDVAPAVRERTERLARRVDPYVGPGSRTVPPLHHAVARRVVEEVGAAGDRAVVAANRAGWHALYFLASRAHRGAVRLHRAAAELQAETGYVAIWASYGVDDRESKDGDL